MTTDIVGPHADDGALLRAIDGAGDAGERAAVAGHLAGCAECRGRERALRDDARVARAWLDADAAALAPPFTWDDVWRRADAASSDARVTARRPRGRRAALLLLLAAGAAAAAPSALRLARGALAARRAAPHGTVVSPQRAAGPTPAAPVSASVAFAVAVDTLDLAFDAAHAGALELVAADEAATVRAVVRGAPGRSRLLVLPGGLRVLGAPAGDAGDATRYRVAVPRGVRAVRVRIGAREPVVVARARLGAAPLVLSLDP